MKGRKKDYHQLVINNKEHGIEEGGGEGRISKEKAEEGSLGWGYKLCGRGGWLR